MSTAEKHYGRATTKKWLNQLEKIIEQEARLGGLLEHGTSIGDAREFFVRRVLRSLIPPMIHIGRGRVIGATSEPSQQVDIVIFDPRFPVFEIEPGMGLYPVEGVIATIEVKSTLTAKTLIQSLNNCYSVMRVEPHSFDDDREPRIVELMKREKLQQQEAELWLTCSLQPKTYVFGFTGYITAESLRAAVEKWCDDEKKVGPVLLPLLPRMIISEGAMGLSADNRVYLSPSGDPAKAVVMQFGPSTARFGMFALHLILGIAERLGTMHFGERVRYSHEKYFPWEDYLAQWKEQDRYFILRDRPVYAP